MAAFVILFLQNHSSTGGRPGDGDETSVDDEVAVGAADGVKGSRVAAIFFYKPPDFVNKTVQYHLVYAVVDAFAASATERLTAQPGPWPVYYD